jgi:hypothetical protein
MGALLEGFDEFAGEVAGASRRASYGRVEESVVFTLVETFWGNAGEVREVDGGDDSVVTGTATDGVDGKAQCLGDVGQESTVGDRAKNQVAGVPERDPPEITPSSPLRFYRSLEDAGDFGRQSVCLIGDCHVGPSAIVPAGLPEMGATW